MDNVKNSMWAGCQGNFGRQDNWALVIETEQVHDDLENTREALLDDIYDTETAAASVSVAADGGIIADFGEPTAVSSFKVGGGSTYTYSSYLRNDYLWYVPTDARSRSGRCMLMSEFATGIPTTRRRGLAQTT